MNKRFPEKLKKQELLIIARDNQIKTSGNINKSDPITLLLTTDSPLSKLKKEPNDQGGSLNSETYSSMLVRAPHKITLQTKESIVDESDSSKITLMVTNPYNAYTYWSLTTDSIEKGYSMLNEKRGNVQEIVRVIDISSTSSKSNIFFCDTDVQFSNKNVWLPLGVPNKEFIVEIGLLTKTGNFLPLAISNSVKTPRDSVSDVIEEKWMNPNRKGTSQFSTSELAKSIKKAETVVLHSEKQFLEKLILLKENSVSDSIYNALKFDEFGVSFLKQIISSMNSSDVKKENNSHTQSPKRSNFLKDMF